MNTIFRLHLTMGLLMTVLVMVPVASAEPVKAEDKAFLHVLFYQVLSDDLKLEEIESCFLEAPAAGVPLPAPLRGYNFPAFIQTMRSLDDVKLEPLMEQKTYCLPKFKGLADLIVMELKSPIPMRYFESRTMWGLQISDIDIAAKFKISPEVYLQRIFNLPSGGEWFPSSPYKGKACFIPKNPNDNTFDTFLRLIFVTTENDSILFWGIKASPEKSAILSKAAELSWFDDVSKPREPRNK